MGGGSYSIGVDLGSTAIKMVLVKSWEIEWSRKVPTAPGQEALALELVRGAMDERGLSEGDIGGIAATGYGKKLMSRAGVTVDEISANAKGLFRLSGGRCRTIINIGGQDLKVITLDQAGKVADFKMNDKCAAGTGRFFEQAARILDTPLESFGKAAGSDAEPAELNSTCVVFAESEMVSLLAKGVPKERIIKGLHNSVARRVANLLGRHRPAGDGDIYLDGGPSQNRGLLEALEDELLTEVKVLPNPQYTVAYGAAISAAGRKDA
ncbi:MAG: acyl-CoA dehydratase activase [Deltaproteobacteria bacterium]|jgi:predicted CoA-substrate-specific enzyme activase|nr:acyl-CoA dehydratase activase [Deltaproteobacteria bacterium]